MSRLTTLAALTAVAATLGLASQADAGKHCRWKPAPPRPIHPAPTYPVPAPTIQPAPTVRPIGYVPTPTVVPARTWYFGMNLQITNTAYGRGLQIASITHGSPASRAGLEVGDVLLAAGNVGLQSAYSNEHGVQLLQSAVGGSAPAPTVTTFVAPTSPNVLLTVLNIRTGQPTYVNVQPHRQGNPVPTYPTPTFPAPAVSAPVANAF
ncbi:MAG: PDZ domain-containing protein [Planctomycetota bacterium]